MYTFEVQEYVLLDAKSTYSCTGRGVRRGKTINNVKKRANGETFL